MKTMHVHTEFGCLFDDNHLHQVNDSHGHRFLEMAARQISRGAKGE